MSKPKKEPKKESIDTNKEEIIDINTSKDEIIDINTSKDEIIEIDYVKDEIIEINYSEPEEIIEIDYVEADSIIDIPTDDIIDIPTSKIVDSQSGDTIRGSSGDDTINNTGSDDLLHGSGSDDIIDGSTDGILDGGAGPDETEDISSDDIIDIDIGKRLDSIIEMDTVRNQASRIGERVTDEARGAMDFIGDMGPQGYKVLAATLIIGLIAGIGGSSLVCGARMRALNVELVELRSAMQDGGLALDGSAAGTIFGYFSIDGIEWDYQGQRFMVEITNTGPTMTFIMSIAVKRFEFDENYYSVYLKGSSGSLAVQSSGTYWWVGSEADAPTDFLEPGTRYRIQVYSSTGFWSEWVEVSPSG